MAGGPVLVAADGKLLGGGAVVPEYMLLGRGILLETGESLLDCPLT